MDVCMRDLHSENCNTDPLAWNRCLYGMSHLPCKGTKTCIFCFKLSIAGSVALCIMMLPLIIRSTEETLKILPSSLKEAGLALGGNSARVMLKIQLPAAFGGIFTGVLLTISRVIGETAPLMFTALGCSLIRFSIDKPISAVPLLIWEFFNDPNLQELIWGASLFLLLFVLTLNLTAKYIAKKWNQ